MIVSIMQPYFFPYIGYFQLVTASDVFVFHDDVQYVKGGWINRNRIFKDGKAVWITYPVMNAPHNLPINKRFYVDDPVTRLRLLRRIEAAYRSAQQFPKVFPLVREIISFGEPSVALFNSYLIRRIATHLGIPTIFLSSSELLKNNSLRGVDRVIEICHRLGATRYINPIGGRKLYRHECFFREGIELAFLKPDVLNAELSPPTRLSPLSIIDSLVREDHQKVNDALKHYRLES